MPSHPPDGAAAPPRQPRREFSSWPIELNHNHLSERALVRATRVMEASLCQEAEDDAVEWSSEDSSNYNYPGAHHQGACCVKVGQLWDKHRTFLAALPAYLQYGEGLRIYHCPCSRGMTELRRRINLKNLLIVRCNRQFTQPPALMQHCHVKNDVYYQGFREYVKAMTEM